MKRLGLLLVVIISAYAWWMSCASDNHSNSNHSHNAAVQQKQHQASTRTNSSSSPASHHRSQTDVVTVQSRAVDTRILSSGLFNVHETVVSDTKIRTRQKIFLQLLESDYSGIIDYLNRHPALMNLLTYQTLEQLVSLTPHQAVYKQITPYVLEPRVSDDTKERLLDILARNDAGTLYDVVLAMPAHNMAKEIAFYHLLENWQGDMTGSKVLETISYSDDPALLSLLNENFLNYDFDDQEAQLRWLAEHQIVGLESLTSNLVAKVVEQNDFEQLQQLLQD